jgi:hypothetical protein
LGANALMRLAFACDIAMALDRATRRVARSGATRPRR